MRSSAVIYVCREMHAPDTGEVSRCLVPLTRFSNIFSRQFSVGGEYVLAPVSERSMASHNHYYAALTEAYNNLPEDQAKKYPTIEHFRKRLLIAAGYHRDRQRPFKNHDNAVRASLLFSEMLEDSDDFAIVVVEDNVVIIRRAKSQDFAHMDKEEFEASKQAVLDLASSMVGVSVGQLKREAGRSA